LLSVHSRYLTIVNAAFRSDAGFMGSLDKACREFTNRNAYCKSSGTSSKSPEYLAKYCDLLLRKSAVKASASGDTGTNATDDGFLEANLKNIVRNYFILALIVVDDCVEIH